MKGGSWLEDYYIDGMGCIVCKLDEIRFYSMHDFKAHCGSVSHRRRFEEKAKPKKRINVRSKIFNYT